MDLSAAYKLGCPRKRTLEGAVFFWGGFMLSPVKTCLDQVQFPVLDQVQQGRDPLTKLARKACRCGMRQHATPG